MNGPKVIGKIELPPSKGKELYKCDCCGAYLPKSQFAYGYAGIFDCYACELDKLFFEPPQGKGNIEDSFREQWVREIEEDWDIDQL